MKGKNSGDLSGFLDAGTHFHGEISFQDTLRIDGQFEGSIKEGRLLIVGESADVNADIHVAVVTVNGRLRGNVHAKERIELKASARCQCNLDTGILVVEEGAVFEGGCAMGGIGGAREVAQLSAAAGDKLKRFGTAD